MNDREKLIELLKKTEITRINGHRALAEVCFTPHVFENMADHLLANGVTVQRWIPVTEEKPKRRGRYFIAYKFRGSDMQFYGEAMWHDDIPDNGYVKGDHFSNEGVEGMYVTHWMEIPRLPAPPKEAEPDA